MRNVKRAKNQTTVRPFDMEYTKAVSETLSEWNSKVDEDAFKDLQDPTSLDTVNSFTSN